MAIITAMPLDPELARYLESQKSLPPRSGLTIEQTRARLVEGARASGGEPATVAAVRDLTLPGGIAAREYGAADAPLLLYFHGGRFISGNLDSHDLLCRRLAVAASCRVVAVDYRLAPEFTFPAASEDMEAVYREVLKTTKPANIGFFGCSAGGTLVAESMAWFQNKKLPTPAAASIQCSGAMPTFWFGGDSNTTAGMFNATFSQSPPPAKAAPGAPRGYFEGVNQHDPLVAPGIFPEVLAKFPPTLVVTGTRDIAESNAIVTYTALLKAGVDARLFVTEGLGHGHFFSFPGTPESATTYDVMWKFFDSHLKK